MGALISHGDGWARDGKERYGGRMQGTRGVYRIDIVVSKAWDELPEIIKKLFSLEDQQPLA